MSKPDIEALIEQTNLHHTTIEFTAETFDTETACIQRHKIQGKPILDAKTYFIQTETFLHSRKKLLRNNL